MAVAISPWTDRAFCWICQPRYLVPAYSRDSLKRATLCRLSRREDHDPGGDLGPTNHEPAHRDGEAKPPRPRAAGVEMEDPGAALLHRLVGMTGHDDADTLCHRLDRKLVEIVQHVDPYAANV